MKQEAKNCYNARMFGGFLTWGYPQIIHRIFHELNHPPAFIETSIWLVISIPEIGMTKAEIWDASQNPLS